MKPLLKKTLMITAALLVTGSASVFAQSGNNDVAQRLQRLENELQTLNRAVYRGDAMQAPVDAMRQRADAQAQIQKVEADMRSLQGQIEQLQHSIDKLQQGLNNVTEANRIQYDDMNKKVEGVRETSKLLTQQVRNLKYSGAGAIASATATAAAQTPDVKNLVKDAANNNKGKGQPAKAKRSGTLPSANALGQYEAAFSLLKKGQYNSAQLRFEEFLKANPNHMLASNAKYWLGETHYVRGEFPQAARIFAEGFQMYPKGAKAPDNLLKLGLTLDALDKKKDACLALAQIGKAFPSGAGSVSSRANQEIKRIGCET